MTRAWFWAAAGALVAMGWFVRPSSGALSSVPADVRTIDLALPQSYGELRTVDRSSLYFENPDGTIHIVHLTPDGEIDQNIVRIVRR